MLRGGTWRGTRKEQNPRNYIDECPCTNYLLAYFLLKKILHDGNMQTCSVTNGGVQSLSVAHHHAESPRSLGDFKGARGDLASVRTGCMVCSTCRGKGEVVARRETRERPA